MSSKLQRLNSLTSSWVGSGTAPASVTMSAMAAEQNEKRELAKRRMRRRKAEKNVRERTGL